MRNLEQLSGPIPVNLFGGKLSGPMMNTYAGMDASLCVVAYLGSKMELDSPHLQILNFRRKSATTSPARAVARGRFAQNTRDQSKCMDFGTFVFLSIKQHMICLSFDVSLYV